mmetsp:Transcript_20718/g.26776  ORF Transcript_20718/g.26776 Transcript_20718/m.26776 type:complete len:876 (+) Transcript_20718:2-2629(+)
MKCNSWRGKLIIFISVAANIFFLVNIRLFTWTPDPYLLQNGGKLEKGKLEKDKIELNEHLDLETTKENSIMNFEEPAPLEAPQRKNLRPSPPRGDQQEGKDEMSPKGGQEEQRARPPRLEPQIPGPIGEKAEEERRRRVREKSDRRAERKPREPDAFQGPLAHEKKRNVAASARQPEGRRAVRREREGIPPDVEERLRQKEELLKAREFNGRVHDWGEEQDVEDAEGLPPPMKGFGKHRGEEGEEGHRHKHPKEPPHGRGAMDREDFHGQKKPHRRQWREDINEREIQGSPPGRGPHGGYGGPPPPGYGYGPPPGYGPHPGYGPRGGRFMPPEDMHLDRVRGPLTPEEKKRLKAMDPEFGGMMGPPGMMGPGGGPDQRRALSREERQAWHEENCAIKPSVLENFHQDCCWSHNSERDQRQAKMMSRRMEAAQKEMEAEGMPHYLKGMMDHGFNKTYRCLPSFIIAGTQKSGSTALTGFLLQHPNAKMARMKELHFFDDKRHYNMGLENYLEAFPDSEPGKENAFISGEATPFYLHSSNACANMKHDIPHARLIILLRNPVDRAYSEWQMKERRVEDQKEFFKIMNADAVRIYKCLLQPDAMHFEKVIECVGPDVANSFGWPKFAGTLRGQGGPGVQRERPPPGLNIHEMYYNRLHRCFKYDGYELDKHPKFHGLLDQMDNWPEFVEHEGMLSYTTNITFPDSRNCYPPYESNKRWEYFVDLEIEEVNNCFSQMTNTTLPHMKQKFEQCFRISNGISKHFIHRSLYAYQLYHCFQSFPKEQILVVESSELHDDPNSAMEKIHKHVGLPQYHYEKTTPEDLDAVIDQYYPKFESLTGWKMDSHYAKMDDSIRSKLAEFFSMHNEYLYELLGRRFSWS